MQKKNPQEQSFPCQQYFPIKGKDCFTFSWILIEKLKYHMIMIQKENRLLNNGKIPTCLNYNTLAATYVH